jgi:hypothetical protein
MRRWVLALGLLLLAAGCGQTDFATQVTSSGAHLNATITSLDQGTSTTGWFQWWPASDPSTIHDTTHRSVTSTGPFGDAIGSLSDQTEYRYRFCGSEGGSDPVCAQTRRFTTGRDTVQAYGATEHTDPNAPSGHYFTDIDFDLVGGPSGTSGTTGLVAHFWGGFGRLDFQLGGSDATVTCFHVDGSTAIVGLLRTNGEVSLQSFVQLVDGGPLGSGQDTASVLLNDPPGTAHRDPSDCSTPLAGALALTAGEIVVNDAP